MVNAGFSRSDRRSRGEDARRCHEDPGPRQSIHHRASSVAYDLSRNALDAPRHLGRSPARESQHQDAARVGAVHNQMRNAMRQSVVFSRFRASDHEKRSVRRRIMRANTKLDGPPLFRIELLEICGGHLCASVETRSPLNHVSRFVRNASVALTTSRFNRRRRSLIGGINLTGSQSPYHFGSG